VEKSLRVRRSHLLHLAVRGGGGEKEKIGKKERGGSGMGERGGERDEERGIWRGMKRGMQRGMQRGGVVEGM